MGDALKANTVLTELGLDCGEKGRNGIHDELLISVQMSFTGNKIGDVGITALSEALKDNTALVILRLDCKHNR